MELVEQEHDYPLSPDPPTPKTPTSPPTPRSPGMSPQNCESPGNSSLGTHSSFGVTPREKGQQQPYAQAASQSNLKLRQIEGVVSQTGSVTSAKSNLKHGMDQRQQASFRQQPQQYTQQYGQQYPPGAHNAHMKPRKNRDSTRHGIGHTTH